jgi:hypothetical protein
MEHKGGATIIDPSGNSIEIPGGIVHDATEIMGKPFDSGVSSPTDGQILVYNSTSGEWETGSQSSSGGSSRWTTWTGASRDSNSKILNSTNPLPAGTPVRYGADSVSWDYAFITGAYGESHYVDGAYVNSTYAVFEYGTLDMLYVAPPIVISGEWADIAETQLLENKLNIREGWEWYGGDAYLVGFRATVGAVDTGTSQPRVNVTNDGSGISSYNGSLGLSPTINGIDANININTAYYGITMGDKLELKTDANGTNNDSKDLKVELIFLVP